MSEEHPALGPDPLIGTTLVDRYRIERKLGEGGMGAVYLARHVILEKIVALKVLHDEYSRRRELVERFLHEAKAASRIRHEHVIDITDFGETKTKNVFFAMEFLEGKDLANELDRAGRLSWPRVKHIAHQLCDALQAAHVAGVIHRDLKPENIYLIERQGTHDFVKVLDFGVAKLTELEEGGRRLTRTGMVFGTPEYMSPEQARGDKPDIRVDVYALGCIIFEMITGDVPFRADNFMGVLTKHLFDKIPRLAERTERRDFPEEVQAIVDKAMHKDREQRYATMKDLAAALDALPAIEPAVTAPVVHRAPTQAPATTPSSFELEPTRAVSTYPPPPPTQPPTSGRRGLWLAAGITVLGAAGLAGYVVLTQGAPSRPTPTPTTPTAPAAVPVTAPPDAGPPPPPDAAPPDAAPPDAAPTVVEIEPEHPKPDRRRHPDRRKPPPQEQPAVAKPPPAEKPPAKPDEPAGTTIRPKSGLKDPFGKKK
jgi:eukaryotic-like serine/threonine-protein kinase